MTIKIMAVLLAVLFTAIGGLAAWHIHHIVQPAHSGAAEQFKSLDRRLDEFSVRQREIAARVNLIDNRLIAQEILLKNLESLEQHRKATERRQ